MKRTRSMAVAALGLTLALAACGSSSKSSAKATPTTAKSSAATTAAGGGGGAATTTAGGSGSTAPVNTNFSGKGSSEWCGLVKKYQDESKFDPNATDTSSMKDTFQKLGQILPDLASKAPGEIKADVQTVADGFQKLITVFKQYDYDFGKLAVAAQKDPSLMQSVQFANDPKFSAASQRIEAYGEKVCGLTPPTT